GIIVSYRKIPSEFFAFLSMRSHRSAQRSPRLTLAISLPLRSAILPQTTRISTSMNCGSYGLLFENPRNLNVILRSLLEIPRPSLFSISTFLGRLHGLPQLSERRCILPWIAQPSFGRPPLRSSWCLLR